MHHKITLGLIFSHFRDPHVSHAHPPHLAPPESTYSRHWTRGPSRQSASRKWIQEGQDGVGHVGIAKVRKNESQCYYMMQGPLKKNSEVLRIPESRNILILVQQPRKNLKC